MPDPTLLTSKSPGTHTHALKKEEKRHWKCLKYRSEITLYKTLCFFKQFWYAFQHALTILLPGHCTVLFQTVNQSG